MATYDLSPLMNGVNNAFNNVIKAKMYSNEMDRKLANDAYNRRYTDARIALTNAQKQGAQQKADIQNQIFSLFNPNKLDERASMLAQNLAGVNLTDVARAMTTDQRRPSDVEYARQRAAYERARANNVGVTGKSGSTFKPDPRQLFQKVIEGKDLYGNPTSKVVFDGAAFVAAMNEMRKAGIPYSNMDAIVALAAKTPVAEVARLYGNGGIQQVPPQQSGGVASRVFPNAGVSIPDVSNGVRALFGNNVPAETGAIDSNSVVTNKNSDGRKSSTSTNSQPIIQTREQIIDLYRKGQISRDEAERMANSAGIPW